MDMIVAIGLFLSIIVAAPSNYDTYVQKNKELKNVKMWHGYSVSETISCSSDTKLVFNNAGYICYSDKLNIPMKSWYLVDGNLSKNQMKKRLSFKKYGKVNPKDYKYSGLDRGHLEDDASFDWDKRILKETYSMVNITPQYPKVNRVVWAKIERMSRKDAENQGKVLVINIVYPGSKFLKNKINIPAKLCKIVLKPKGSKSWEACVDNVKDPNGYHFAVFTREQWNNKNIKFKFIERP